MCRDLRASQLCSHYGHKLFSKPLPKRRYQSIIPNPCMVDVTELLYRNIYIARADFHKMTSIEAATHTLNIMQLKSREKMKQELYKLSVIGWKLLYKQYTCLRIPTCHFCAECHFHWIISKVVFYEFILNLELLLEAAHQNWSVLACTLVRLYVHRLSSLSQLLIDILTVPQYNINSVTANMGGKASQYRGKIWLTSIVLWFNLNVMFSNSN